MLRQLPAFDNPRRAGPASLVAEGDDGVQLRRTARRKEAEDHPGEPARGERERERHRVERHRPLERAAERGDGREADPRPGEAVREREDHGLPGLLEDRSRDEGAEQLRPALLGDGVDGDRGAPQPLELLAEEERDVADGSARLLREAVDEDGTAAADQEVGRRGGDAGCSELCSRRLHGAGMAEGRPSFPASAFSPIRFCSGRGFH